MPSKYFNIELLCYKIIKINLKSSVFLIGSIPGRFPASKKLFGHLRLRKILSDHANIEVKEAASHIVCQFSSIGSLGPNEKSWLCKEFNFSLSRTNKPHSDNNIKPICVI